MKIFNRNSLSIFLNENNLTNTGAEIGVKNGRFSDKLLSKWNGNLLYSIDCWSGEDPTTNKRYINTKNLLKKYKNRSKIIIATSERARVQIKNNSLDFCYIDADHKYEEVKKDINWWWEKVKKEGILCGHDYGYNFKPREEWPWSGVNKAVNEFCEENNLTVYTDTEKHKKAISWYIKK
tara:strand:+ start:362 stop:898 length:537 start_codon:yes stop_codon:yes gene_type:complete